MRCALSSRRTTTWFLSSALVISIVANIIRNTVLSFFHGTGREAAFQWLHDSWGGDLYSAGMLLLLVPLLNWMNNYFSTDLELPEETENAR